MKHETRDFFFGGGGGFGVVRGFLKPRRGEKGVLCEFQRIEFFKD